MYSKEEFFKLLQKLPEDVREYIVSNVVVQKCSHIYSQLHTDTKINFKLGLLIGFYLGGSIPDIELAEVIANETGINKKDAQIYANVIITEFESDREKEEEPQEEQKVTLSEEMINTTKKNETPLQGTEVPRTKPLDTEIMSHFGKSPFKEESVEASEPEMPPEPVQVKPAPIPEPVEPTPEKEKPPVSAFTYNPHAISRFGSVMPENHVQTEENPTTKESEEEKPLPSFKQAPAPQPESSVPVKKPETQPVLEVEKANEKSADSYHGQDPYREPVS